MLLTLWLLCHDYGLTWRLRFAREVAQRAGDLGLQPLVVRVELRRHGEGLHAATRDDGLARGLARREIAQRARHTRLHDRVEVLTMAPWPGACGMAILSTATRRTLLWPACTMALAAWVVAAAMSARMPSRSTMSCATSAETERLRSAPATPACTAAESPCASEAWTSVATPSSEPMRALLAPSAERLVRARTTRACTLTSVACAVAAPMSAW